jgi:hypothetical protein
LGRLRAGLSVWTPFDVWWTDGALRNGDHFNLFKA